MLKVHFAVVVVAVVVLIQVNFTKCYIYSLPKGVLIQRRPYATIVQEKEHQPQDKNA